MLLNYKQLPPLQKLPIPRLCKIICASALLSLISIPGWGQAHIDPSLPPGSQPLIKRRVALVFPDYGSVPETDTAVAALSAKQKFQMFVGETLDPSVLLIAGGTSGISQWGDFTPNYGQGGKAYAQRLGADLASIASANLLSEAALPSLFHQDPRYFRKGTGTVSSRLWYAIEQVLVARADSGGHVFNYSRVAGYAGSIAVSNAYLPDVNRTATANASRFGIGMGLAAAVNVVREFSLSPFGAFGKNH
jgi:hypothetical protein